MKLVHWPLISGLLYLVQRGGDWAEPQPTQALLRYTKCTSSPINGQLPITVLLYNGGPLLYAFNVPIKGLRLYAMAMSFCFSLRLFIGLFVRLSPVKFVKSFATRQHQSWRRAAAYHIDSNTPAVAAAVWDLARVVARSTHRDTGPSACRWDLIVTPTHLGPCGRSDKVIRRTFRDTMFGKTY